MPAEPDQLSLMITVLLLHVPIEVSLSITLI